MRRQPAATSDGNDLVLLRVPGVCERGKTAARLHKRDDLGRRGAVMRNVRGEVSDRYLSNASATVLT